MPNTYIKIASVIVGAAGQANIEFTSIPQTYTDLKLLVSLRTNRSSTVDLVGLSFNGLTTNRASIELFGTGSTAGGGTDTTTMYFQYANAATATASVFNNGELYIPNYTSSTTFKAPITNAVSENNATQAYQAIYANLWSNTAAITSITLTPIIGTQFVQYSTATLYGIKSS